MKKSQDKEVNLNIRKASIDDVPCLEPVLYLIRG